MKDLINNTDNRDKENAEKERLINKKETENLTKIQAGRYFLNLALPFAGVRFISASAEFAAAYMLAQIDSTHLAASGVISVTNQFVVITSSIGLYATSILQKQIINNEPDRVGTLFATSCIIAIGAGVAESLLLSEATKPLFIATGMSESVASLVSEYFRSLSLTGGILTGLTSVSSQQTCYTLNKPYLVLGIGIFRQIIYLSSSYALIYGKFGLPTCDVSGLAYGRSLASALDQLLFVAYFLADKNSRNKYGLLSFNIRSILKEAPDFIKKGAMLSFQGFNEFFIGLFNILAIGRTTNAQLAAAEIAMQYNNLLQIPVLVSGQVCAIQVGAHAKNLVNVKAIMQAATALTLFVPLISIPIFVTIPDKLASVFESNSDLDSLGGDSELPDTMKWLLLIVACNQVPNVLRQVFSGALRGIGNFNAPLLINFISMTLAGVGMSYLLGEVLGLESIGFFLGVSTGMVVSASTLVTSWIIGHTQQEEHLPHPNSLLMVKEERNIVSRALSYVYSFWSPHQTDAIENMRNPYYEGDLLDIQSEGKGESSCLNMH